MSIRACAVSVFALPRILENNSTDMKPPRLVLLRASTPVVDSDARAAFYRFWSNSGCIRGIGIYAGHRGRGQRGRPGIGCSRKPGAARAGLGRLQRRRRSRQYFGTSHRRLHRSRHWNRQRLRRRLAGFDGAIFVSGVGREAVEAELRVPGLATGVYYLESRINSRPQVRSPDGAIAQSGIPGLRCTSSRLQFYGSRNYD